MKIFPSIYTNMKTKLEHLQYTDVLTCTDVLYATRLLLEDEDIDLSNADFEILSPNCLLDEAANAIRLSGRKIKLTYDKDIKIKKNDWFDYSNIIIRFSSKFIQVYAAVYGQVNQKEK